MTLSDVKEKLRGLFAAGPELPEDRSSRRTAAALFLAAFALRAVFLLQWAGLPYAASPCADAWAYENWALEILRGGLVRHTAFYQSPLYPYLLAGVYKVFGHHPAVMLWLQALAGSVTVVLVYRLGRACFSPAAGVLAGVLAVFYRPFIFHTAVAGKETFAVLAVALAAALALKAAERDRARDYFLCGLAAGAGALLRTNALLLLPAAMAWLWLLHGRWAGFAVRRALPLLLGAALALLPAALHNWYAAHDLVAVNYNGGFTFFLGNNTSATGIGDYPPGFIPDPLLEESQPAAIAEREAGRPLKPSEVSRYWLKRGLSFIAEEPGRWAALTAAKFFFFWNRYEIPDNYDLQFVTAHGPALLRLPLFTFALAGCLGAAGLFLCRVRRPSGLLLFLFLAYLVSLLPFWMSDRYRLPALALLLPLAGGALAGLFSAAPGPGRRGTLRAFALASPLVVICLMPPPFNMRYAEASGWAQLVNVCRQAGDPACSVAALGRVSALEPSLMDPSVICSAAASLDALGRRAEARELRRAGAAAYPGSPLPGCGAGSEGRRLP